MKKLASMLFALLVFAGLLYSLSSTSRSSSSISFASANASPTSDYFDASGYLNSGYGDYAENPEFDNDTPASNNTNSSNSSFIAGRPLSDYPASSNITENYGLGNESDYWNETASGGEDYSSDYSDDYVVQEYDSDPVGLWEGNLSCPFEGRSFSGDWEFTVTKDKTVTGRISSLLVNGEITGRVEDNQLIAGASLKSIILGQPVEVAWNGVITEDSVRSIEEEAQKCVF